MAAERFRPDVVVKKLTHNCYSPRGAQIKLIVLHSTESHNREGSSDLEAIANYFMSPATEASSHVLTDADGKSARCVNDADAAWTAGWVNRLALQIEMIGQAAQESWAEKEVKETARWIARWSHLHGVPIRRAWTVPTGRNTGRVIRSGVTLHRKVSGEGGHWDPGYHFPLRRTLKLARHYKELLQKAS